MTLDEVKRRVTNNTVGVIVVHIGGIISPEIEKISQWCEDNNLWLFEDASHAVGSTYMDKHPGSFGIAAAYSFFATKIITGMLNWQMRLAYIEIMVNQKNGKRFIPVWEIITV